MNAKEFKINNFDLIRLFAATQVLIFHSISHLQIKGCSQWINLIGPLKGVPIFFVISGFLISASIEEHFELKNYLRNRILRIYPALWACIILSVFTIYFVANINFLNWPGIRWFLAQCVGIIYTPFFLKIYGFGSYNGSLWTIPVELQFYILLPVIYYVNSKITSKELIKTIIISILFLLFCLIAYYITNYNSTAHLSESTIQKLLRYSFIPHLYLFLLGVLLQRFQVYKYKVLRNKGLFWIIGYLLYSFLIPPNAVLMVFGNLFLGICMISIAYSFSGLSNKILQGNDISYGVYIYHGLVVGILVQLKIVGNFYYLSIVLVVTYFIAFLSWKLLEVPFIKMKRQTFRALTYSPK